MRSTEFIHWAPFEVIGKRNQHDTGGKEKKCRNHETEEGLISHHIKWVLYGNKSHNGYG